MNTKEALQILDELQAKIGDDTQIESVNADLITLKEFLSEIDTEIDILNTDVSNLNEKVRSLQQSNNTLFRQIGKQQELTEKHAEEMSTVAQINNLL